MALDVELSEGKIKKRVLIRASAEVIFQALTDAADLIHWFCDRATCDPREGGELAVYWKTGKTGQNGRAIFTRLVALSQVELRWIDDGYGPPPEGAYHVLSFSIRPGHSSSEVLMRDEGYPVPDAETISFMDDGWNGVLLELKDYCEQKERAGKNRATEDS